jgi:hypothetical protein
MPAGTDHLKPPEFLQRGQALYSQGRGYKLYFEPDGKLVLYRHDRTWVPDGRPLWTVRTDRELGRFSWGGICIMQNDGNLVIYDPQWTPLWASGSHGHRGSRLLVQDDGNVVIYRPDGRAVWATHTVQRVVWRPPVPESDLLEPGQGLSNFPEPGPQRLVDRLYSPNRRYCLGFVGDSMCLFRNSRLESLLWCIPYRDLPAIPDVALMQHDGNLVIYSARERPLWASGTHGHPHSWLQVQNDGNLVIYKPGARPLWAADSQPAVSWGPHATADRMQPDEVLEPLIAYSYFGARGTNPDHWLQSSNGRYAFGLEEDGNLALYATPRGLDRRTLQGMTLLWTSGLPHNYTIPHPWNHTRVCVMQSDGNLVIYDGMSNPRWASGTDGSPGSYLRVQDDGNVVIYRPEGRAIWQTNTRQLTRLPLRVPTPA